MKNEKGFTLLEIIVVMVLVAILSAVAGLGIVNSVQGYLFAKENAPTTQKANLAMVRMSRELMELAAITNTVASPNTSVTFKAPYDGPNPASTLAFSGGQITIGDTNIGYDTLADNVQSLTLTYIDTSGTASLTWSGSMNTLAVIQIDLVLNGRSFSTRVIPRNTGNLNAPVS